MTKDGVPKPAWRAFQLLHEHGGDHQAKTTIKQPSAPAAAAGAAAVQVGGAQPTETCGLVPDTDFRGGDILPDSQHLVLPDAAACCAACQNHTGTSPETRCQMWSWGSPKSGCCASRCYLKQLTASGHATHDDTFTSGYVGPVPPPPPPPGPKPLISVLATVNGTASDMGSLRVFLGFWGNPDAGSPSASPPVPVAANRSVTVTVSFEEGHQPKSTVGLRQIGGGVCDPQTAWIAMGSPASPSPSQLDTLMAASAVGIGSTTATFPSTTTAVVTVEMAENMAYVLVFDAMVHLDPSTVHHPL
jgi:hypothetical protein